MAGGVLKTIGIILIAIGGVAAVFGIAAAVFGGSVVSGAASDASRNDCGVFHNEPCTNGDVTQERAQAGATVALVGGLGIAGGLALAVVGIGLLMWGVSRARKAHARAFAPW